MTNCTANITKPKAYHCCPVDYFILYNNFNCVLANKKTLPTLLDLKYLIFFCVLLLTGCASSLTQWTDQQLSPYLANELGRHPRFKNQPIQLVSMQGDNVQTEIDALTSDVRDRVFNQLLQSPGVNIVLESPDQIFTTFGKLSELNCYPNQNPEYFIGFDIKANAGEYQLTVKALDIGQGNWVSGFGKTWSGNLNKTQLQALKTLHPDQLLSGSRRMPYTEQQSDLLANHLARRFSCLLKQLPEEYVSIYLDRNTQSSSLIQHLLQQIGHHISRFREISLTDSKHHAAMLLTLQLHPIKPGLQQLWLVAKQTTTGQHIAGLDTDAYVNFKSSSLLAKPNPLPHSNPKPKPPTPLPNAHTNKKSKQKSQPDAVQLFSTLQVISPIGEPFCRTTNPWLMGDVQINIKHALPYCFGFKIKTVKDVHVFILNSDPSGHYYRIIDENNTTGEIPMTAHKSYRYPNRQLFNLDPSLTYETMHLVAVSDASTARQFKQLIAAIPACCDSHAATMPNDWEYLLHSFVETHRQTMEWRIIKLHPER